MVFALNGNDTHTLTDTDRQTGSIWSERLQSLFTDKLKPTLYIYCLTDNFTAHLFISFAAFTVTLGHSLSFTMHSKRRLRL